MAGGFGTRMKPLTVSVPKPMVPVGNRPLMEYVIELLARHHFTRILVLLYFQPETIVEHFGDGAHFGVHLEYVRPDADYGTAGSVRYALPRLADRFLVISADILTDIDLTAAVEFHSNSRAEATMVLTRRDNPLPFGIVVTDPVGRVVRFLEKPAWGEVFSDTINTGLYILEKSLLEPWPSEQFTDFGKHIFPQSLSQGRSLYGYVSSGYWRDVGNLTDYLLANQDLLEKKVRVRWPYGERTRGRACLVHAPDCVIAEDATFDGTVFLGDRVSIGTGAHISDSVIGAGSVVGSSAQVRRSVLWSAVMVGAQSTLDETIIQTGARLGDNVTLMERTIVSEMCRIGNGATVKANCRIWPRKRIEEGATVASSVVWGEQYNRELFTDSKVSGLTNREITPEFAARLGAAFASMYDPYGTVVLARDRTVEGRTVGEALKSGIASAGVCIRDLRDTIVPIVRFDLKQGGGRAGVYVRSSPDIPQSTDLIFFDHEGFDLPAGTAQSVERLFFSEDFRRADPSDIGSISYPDSVAAQYRQDFLHQVNVDAVRARDFRLVVDYAGGLAGTILPPILSEMGVDAISLNVTPGRQDLGGGRQDNVALSRIVTAVECDLGVSINAPGEKIVAVDRSGVVLSSQQLLLTMAELFWRLHPGTTIAVPVAATRQVENLAARAGGKVVRVKNDHLAMMRAAASESADFVCGTRGGFILPPWQRGTDAMASLVCLLEFLALTDTDLSQLIQDCQPGAMVEARIACPWSLKGHLMRRVLDFTDGVPRQLVDGVRLVSDDATVWMAPGRRTAHFLLLIESFSLERSKSLAEEWTNRLTEWRDASD
jgi:mannose-1-phosphate guanylyltransferase/phosphomannomutase